MAKNTNQVVLLKQMIQRAEKQLETAHKMLAKLDAGEDIGDSLSKIRVPSGASSEDGEVVEGVFDGVSMIGADGRSYTVPANYASKSKLVEGDLLKLTITNDGSFLYKQIGPVERKRLRSTLMQDEDTGEYTVMAQGNVFKVLSASVTYYKGEVGDEVVILVPSDKQSRWSAVETIMKQLGTEAMNHGDDLDKATADLL
ncbi:MAG: hypothetical protein AAB880_01905 [Patescibacteria group bacterium]